MPADEGGVIGDEIDRKHRNLLGGADSSHRLAIDEVLQRRFRRLARALGMGGDAVAERWRLDRAGTDGVYPNPLAMKSIAVALVRPITAALVRL